MAYMRIHCGDCGMVKEVHKYVPDDTEVRYCPLCGSEIDRDIWETMIIPAVELLNKANRAFIAKHTEENTTPIYIDVLADHFTRDDMQDNSRNATMCRLIAQTAETAAANTKDDDTARQLRYVANKGRGLDGRHYMQAFDSMADTLDRSLRRTYLIKSWDELTDNILENF